MEEKAYSVSEAVRLIGVESHVLRYWEEELQFKIQRTGQGHRIYSGQDIETFRKVKSLKEKGIQLKAIRVLLEETEKPGKTLEEAGRQFVEQICEQERPQQEHPKQERPRQEHPQQLYSQQSAAGEESFEIVTTEIRRDNLQQFETILKHLMEDVLEEQNEKLERAIAEVIREEIEELYLRYCHTAMEEAAAASEKKKTGKFDRIWKKIIRVG